MASSETLVEHRLDAEGADALMLAGVTDRNIHEVSRLFGVRMILRGNHVIISGELGPVERAIPVVMGADGAGRAVGEGEAGLADDGVALEPGDRFRELARELFGRAQQEVGETRGGLLPDPRESLQARDQPIHCR